MTRAAEAPQPLSVPRDASLFIIINGIDAKSAPFQVTPSACRDESGNDSCPERQYGTDKLLKYKALSDLAYGLLRTVRPLSRIC